MQIKRLTDDARIPIRATDGSAGYDIYANNNSTLEPLDSTIIVRTGIAIYIEDPNLVGLIFPRSGLSIRTHSRLWNTVAVIDSDYQGEIVLYMSAENYFTISLQERIAQILFVPIQLPTFDEVQEFSYTTNRGAKGFGSTGK